MREGYEKSVFINCPFDSLFEPLFHAIVLTVGIRCLGESEGRISGGKHNWVALVPDNFVHLRFISDLAGYDASDHDETPATVIKRVASWLSLQPDFTPPTPSAKTILGNFAPFRDLLIKFQEQSLGTLTWPAIIKATESVVAQMN